MDFRLKEVVQVEATLELLDVSKFPKPNVTARNNPYQRSNIAIKLVSTRSDKC